jgi:hypothetical protein
VPATFAAWPDPILYLAAGGLAAAASASELIGRFRDEPFQAVSSRPGALYLLVNALLGAIVLAALRLAEPANTGVSALEQVLLAGFGARIILRAKLVKVRGKQGTEESGPGEAFDRLLATIRRSADRDRAAQRLKLVSSLLAGMDWIKVRDFFPAEMGGAMQALTDDEQETIRKTRETIEAQKDDLTRIHLLGYLILEFGGKEFLTELAGLYRKRFPDQAPAGDGPSTLSAAPNGEGARPVALAGTGSVAGGGGQHVGPPGAGDIEGPGAGGLDVEVV